MRKPQLHYSQLDMLARCGVQFQFRYGETFGVGPENKIVPPGIALAIGSATHEAVEVNLKSKMETGEPADIDEVVSKAADTVHTKWGEGILLTEKENENPEETLDATVDKAVQLSALHYNEVAPQIDPIAVEKPFVIELDDFPVNLSGRIDVLTLRGIRDSKTIAKTPPRVEPGHMFQIGLYSWSEQLRTGHYPETATLDYLIKTKTPKAVSHSFKPTDEIIAPVRARIQRAVEVIDAVKRGHKAFTPADPGHWVCSEKYCGYAQECQFWSGR